MVDLVSSDTLTPRQKKLIESFKVAKPKKVKAWKPPVLSIKKAYYKPKPITYNEEEFQKEWEAAKKQWTWHEENIKANQWRGEL